VTTDHTHRPNATLTLTVLALGSTAYALLQSLVAPALPAMQHSLHTSEASISWVLTAYLLAASIATPILGRLGDMFGKERVLLITLVALAFGTLLAAIASSVGLLIVARLIQGAGGGIFPLAFGIIRDEFPRERVAGGIGLISALLGIGGGLGVVLAGLIVDNLSWHWLFWLPLVAIVIAAFATHRYVPESPIKVPGKVNWLGAALMSAALTAILLAVSEGQDWGWTSAKTLGLLAIGLLLVPVWIWSELRTDAPLVDMKMMRIKGVWTTNLVATMLGVGMYSSFILIPQLVQLPKSTGFGFGATVTAAGVFLLPCSAMMMVAGSLTGRLEARFGSKPPLIAGAAFSAVAFALLAVEHSSHLGIYVASALLGLGVGFAFASMANLIVENVRQDQTGVATGMNTVTRTVGGAIGAVIAATLLSDHVDGKGLPTESGFTLAFWFCAAALVIGLLAAFAIPNRARTQRERAEQADVAAELA